MSAKISAIVPVYNNEQYLAECLESILNQSYKDIELIVVEDGSTDASARICDDYASKDSRVRVIHQANQGVAVTRNVGVSAATGQYVIFVDSDDKLHPDAVSFMLKTKEETQSEAVLAWYTNENESRLSTDGIVSTFSSKDAIELILYQKGLDCSLCYKLLPIEAVRLAPETPGIRYEDLDSIYRILENIDGTVAATTARIYYYRKNPRSFINNFTPDRLDVLYVTERIAKYYANDAQLSKAARDRQFSANYNMFVLATRAGMKERAANCWEMIKKLRAEEIYNHKTRFKNKIGALVSYLGKGVVMLAAKTVY